MGPIPESQMEVEATPGEAAFLAATPLEGSLLFNSFTPPSLAAPTFWDQTPLETLSFQSESSTVTTPQPPTDDWGTFPCPQDGWGDNDWGTPFRSG